MSDAVIVAVPAATAVKVNVALDAPTGIVTGVCTVTTAGLLLVSEMLAPPESAAAIKLTVPCPLAPATRLAVVKETPDTAELVGATLEPAHCVRAAAAAIVMASERDALARRLMFKEQSFSVCTRAVAAARRLFTKYPLLRKHDAIGLDELGAECQRYRGGVGRTYGCLPCPLSSSALTIRSNSQVNTGFAVIVIRSLACSS